MLNDLVIGGSLNPVYILIERHMPVQARNEQGELVDSAMYLKDSNTVVTHYAHAAYISDMLLRAGHIIVFGAPPVFTAPVLNLRRPIEFP